MQEIILGEYPTLGHLIGSLNTADAATCDLCGKKHNHTHDKDCGYFKGDGGDCNCGHYNEILEVAGLSIVNECCGAKLMEIIACLVPSIAENIVPLLRKYSADISSIANRLAPQEQWCLFRKRGGPTILGILIGIISGNGHPELIIMGVDEKLYQYHPALDVFFELYKDKNTAIREYKQLVGATP